MRILRIDQEVPYPPDNGGRLETYHTTKQLTLRGHDVTLLAFQRGERDVSPLREFCDLYAIPFNGKNSVSKAIRGVLERTPINYIKWRYLPMLNQCLELLRTRRYDVLVVDHSALGWYVFEVRKQIEIPIISRWHDLETLMWERWVGSQTNPIKRALGRRQCEFVREYERKLAATCNACLTIGAHDTELLREMAPTAHLRFVPAGVDTEFYSPNPKGQESSSILFLASHHKWHANFDAARWLYEEIMPRIWERIPGCKVYITGRNAPAEMQTWAEDKRVILTGFVPDERVVIAQACALVIPMRLGAGIKLKMLTAFACGKAVVSTTRGAEGMPNLVDGEQLLIRNSAQEFADATVEVLENEQLRRRLEANGRALVCQNYDWSAIGAQWEEALVSVTSRQTTFAAHS